jgi:RNA polymerase sigma-70 factor (ECF subfamily)
MSANGVRAEFVAAAGGAEWKTRMAEEDEPEDPQPHPEVAAPQSGVRVATPTVHEVYQKHFRFVWAALRRLGVPESDTADAAQEVFLIVHRRLHTFEGRSELTTWLFAIAARVAKDRHRLAYHRRETPAEDPSAGGLMAPLHQQPEATAEHAAQQQEASAILERILQQMTPGLRIVFVMFEVEGLDGESIANELGLPVGTVRSRLRLAREVFERAVARLRHAEGHHV